MSSREEAQALRVQMEEQKERARKDVQEAQRHGNDAQRELDQSQMTLRRLEEEVGVSFIECTFAQPVHEHSCSLMNY